MKAISCPQCGSLIKNILPRKPLAECDYCGARVIVGEQSLQPEPFDDEAAKFRALERVAVRPRSPVQPIFVAISGIGIFIFLMFLISFLPAKTRSAAPPAPEIYKPITFPTIAPFNDKDDDAALKFGGKGTSAGLFDGACAVAVANSGDIFVADETRRIQRFDAGGKFLNFWTVKGAKNELIDKIAAAANGDIYVLTGGEIVVFKGAIGEQRFVLGDSQRHFIDDFVLLDDGGLLYVAESGGREEFVRIKDKITINRFAGIHSLAAGAKIPARGIKIAAGGNGDIFSVFAVSSLEGTSEYNDEDLMTFRFTRDGKFVNKFAANLMPEAILIDNQSRVYILTLNEIAVFSGDGGAVTRLPSAGIPTAFAIDAQNNLYTVADNIVRKLKPAAF